VAPAAAPSPTSQEAANETATAPTPAVPTATDGRPAEIETGLIDPNPCQPRQDFDEDGIEELMASIRSSGIIQPVVVRPKPPGRYELVSGERRLRAAEALGMATVPAVVRDVPDDRLLEMALIENIQRRDLNPIEKAEAFHDFMAEYHLTQEEAARRVGVDRASLANHVRLLELPAEIQLLVRRQALGMSHARTIAALPDPADQLDLAKRTIRDGLSVRQLERVVQRAVQDAAGPAAAVPGSTRSASSQVVALENELRGLLGTKVRIEEGRKPGTGRIVVDYYSYDDFDRILSAFRR
jgi:ParB family chromosome partitioning protein